MFCPSQEMNPSCPDHSLVDILSCPSSSLDWLFHHTIILSLISIYIYNTQYIIIHWFLSLVLSCHKLNPIFSASVKYTFACVHRNVTLVNVEGLLNQSQLCNTGHQVHDLWHSHVFILAL
jgi:hypothetical protein